jgi:hypothetical protein
MHAIEVDRKTVSERVFIAVHVQWNDRAAIALTPWVPSEQPGKRHNERTAATVPTWVRSQKSAPRHRPLGGILSEIDKTRRRSVAILIVLRGGNAS